MKNNDHIIEELKKIKEQVTNHIPSRFDERFDGLMKYLNTEFNKIHNKLDTHDRDIRKVKRAVNDRWK